MQQTPTEHHVPSVDVVIPVYNEEHVLERSVITLRDFLRAQIPYEWRILIADNASTDRTLEVAKGLAARYPDDVAYLHLPQKGRGRALRTAWMASDADILSYMDVDLSTGLEAFPPLVQAIAVEGYDLATGSRLMQRSHIVRSLKREILSRGYFLMIQALFGVHFTDAQCGFKALSRQAARALLPLVQNQEWFFDTELFVLAEKNGYRIKDVPIRWIEDPDSRVNIPKTIAEDVRGLLRLRFHLPRVQPPARD
ncbi:MAG: glycosyltransferase family 2 protein [Chloroflexi bacterium]|nr:glycosyltransferase family 2 protein [Chloroflexota bacterium]